MNPDVMPQRPEVPPVITSIEVSFPGGKRVDAQIGDRVISTDQSRRQGGSDSAPGPFDLFLASIATCAGVYALAFCHARDLPTEGLKIRQEVIDDPAARLPGEIRLHVTPPLGFPEALRPALLRAIGACKVKKTIAHAPAFEIGIEAPDGA